MSLRIWRALFTLAVRLGLRGRLADWIEERFYRECLRETFDADTATEPERTPVQAACFYSADSDRTRRSNLRVSWLHWTRGGQA